MRSARIEKLVITALFAALVTVTTVAVQIPSPMNGYVNLGDCFVLLSGWILGPLYGAAAGGVGAMLADLFTGYAHYAPGTLLIKAAMVLVASLVYNHAGRKPLFAQAISALAAEAVMVGGYFLYASLLLGRGLAATASIPGNLIQGVVGIAAAMAVMHVLKSSRLLDQIPKIK